MANFFGRFQERFNEAMQGRNGMDTLARFSFYVGFILVIIDLFVGSLLLSTPALVLLIYSIFRSYSRNIAARERENASFEGFLAKIHFPFGGRSRQAGNNRTGNQTGQSSATSSQTSEKQAPGDKGAPQIPDEVNTIYFTCSNCGQKLSVPRGKGTLRVTCPHCHLVTTVKS